MKKTIIIIVIVLILLGVAWFVLRFLIGGSEKPTVCTMDAKLCSDGSYVGRVPPDCNFSLCPKEDLITIESPIANEETSSPLLIKGQARGFWFFEADFPIKLFDGNGDLIAVAIAQAKGDWMTEDFVPFEGLLEFTITEEMDATLILEKDNPSGLPENADELRIPVRLVPES